VEDKINELEINEKNENIKSSQTYEGKSKRKGAF
jgi:hypothetical protein